MILQDTGVFRDGVPTPSDCAYRKTRKHGRREMICESHPPKQCLVAIYSHGAWTCEKKGEPCGAPDLPACASVPADQLWTTQESTPGEFQRVHANPDGSPIYQPVEQPDTWPPDVVGSQWTPYILWFGAAAAAYMLVRGRR